MSIVIAQNPDGDPLEIGEGSDCTIALIFKDSQNNQIYNTAISEASMTIFKHKTTNIIGAADRNVLSYINAPGSEYSALIPLVPDDNVVLDNNLKVGQFEVHALSFKIVQTNGKTLRTEVLLNVENLHHQSNT